MNCSRFSTFPDFPPLPSVSATCSKGHAVCPCTVHSGQHIWKCIYSSSALWDYLLCVRIFCYIRLNVFIDSLLCAVSQPLLLLDLMASSFAMPQLITTKLTCHFHACREFYFLQLCEQEKSYDSAPMHSIAATTKQIIMVSFYKAEYL